MDSMVTMVSSSAGLVDGDVNLLEETADDRQQF